MANTYRLWYRKTYNLAPTDPRYLASTDEDIEAEYWAYQYESGGVKEEFEDDDFDAEALVREMEEKAEAEARAARDAATAAPDLPDVDDWEEVDD